MLQSVSMGGLGQTFGRFTCNATICYGTDGGLTHALFKEVQYQLNRAGAKLVSGWKPIAVDGFIGAGTLSAARQIFPFSGQLVARALSYPPDFVTLAKWIREDAHSLILDEMRALGDKLAGPEPASAEVNRQLAARQEAQKTTASSPAPSTAPATIRPAGGAPAPAPAPEKSKTPWVVLGIGTAFALVAAAAAFTVRRRRHRRRARRK